MLLESWSGRVAFTVCGLILVVIGIWGVVRPGDIPLNVVDPSASPAMDVVNQVCTVVICLSFLGAGGLLLWTVVYSIRMSMQTVDDTPRDAVTLKRVVLQVLLVVGILLAMLLGSLVLDYWLHL